MKLVIAIAAAVAISAPLTARAQTDDPSFGPRIVIERIEVTGNDWTAERVIRRALPVKAGDALRAGDPRLRDARFKVLALGYFRDVQLSLEKGRVRGNVVLVVHVVERGTIVLNRLYFGTAEATPWWLGIDLGDRNFLGTGLDVGTAFVYADELEAAGGTSQWAGELRIGATGIGGTRLGAHGALRHVDASEPYRVRGDAADGSPSLFDAFSYARTGATVGVSIDVTPLSTLSFDGRFEHVDADRPAAPTRVLEDGTSVHVDLGLQSGDSRVATIGIGFDRDTRPDPVLPFTGDRVTVVGELGGAYTGSDYDFASVLARYERWFPVRGVRHVVSVHLTGGVILGEAPLFDRFYIGDVNRLLSPRALGLVVSTLPSHDLLGASAADVTYGEVAGQLEVQYSRRLFRSGGPIYGGDIFVGAGVFGLATRADFTARDEALVNAMPVDLMFDVGLRLDTEVGIFELTFANGLGRLPL